MAALIDETVKVTAQYEKPAPISDDNSKLETDIYDFSHRSRGVALIVCNETFKGHSNREGAQKDVQHFRSSFLRLGFSPRDIRIRYNMTVDDMLDWFLAVSMESHKHHDCLAVAISSHGDQYTYINPDNTNVEVREDIIYGTDKVVLTRVLVDIFRDEYCPTLAGKPKIFFLQACRGTELDQGVEVGQDEVDAPSQEQYTISPAPCFKDFCIVYATPPGHFAFRRPTEGSWFVKALWDVIQNIDPARLEFQKIVSRVFQQVGVAFESSSDIKAIDEKKQSGCMYSMLTKDIFFAPKTEKTEKTEKLDDLIAGLQKMAGPETAV